VGDDRDLPARHPRAGRARARPGDRAAACRARQRRLEALQGKGGTPLRGTANVTLRGTTAIVPVAGPLFRYANLFTDMSGATSLEQLAADFTTAADSPQVARVLLAIDSPGGQVNGIAEFATLVRDAQARKPVIAYVSDTAASGAYWIASAAGTIHVAPTALLGSIGVVMSAPAGKDQTRIEIVSSQSPNKRPDITTDAGRAQVQTLVDRLGQEFIATVAANRRTTEAKVLSDFGQGGVLVGADAVAAGMADQVTTLERLLAGPADAGRSGSSSLAASAAAVVVNLQENPTMSDTAPKPAGGAPVYTTIAELQAAFPDLCAALAAEAATTAGPAERTRVLGMQAHGRALPGHDALVEAAIDDGRTTPDQLAGRLVTAAGEKGQKVLATLRADGAEGPKPAPSAATPAAAADPAKPVANTPEAWAAEYKASAALQAEFPAEQDYVALRRPRPAAGPRPRRRPVTRPSPSVRRPLHDHPCRQQAPRLRAGQPQRLPGDRGRHHLRGRRRRPRAGHRPRPAARRGRPLRRLRRGQDRQRGRRRRGGQRPRHRERARSSSRSPAR
jgi:ClpP class serine protease